ARRLEPAPPPRLSAWARRRGRAARGRRPTLRRCGASGSGGRRVAPTGTSPHEAAQLELAETCEHAVDVRVTAVGKRGNGVAAAADALQQSSQLAVEPGRA